MSWSPASPAPRPAEAKSQADLAKLFHRLNNQLGVILANAELLESKLTEETQRSRASQIGAGALRRFCHPGSRVLSSPVKPIGMLNFDKPHSLSTSQR
jgi:hypothetical protein